MTLVRIVREPTWPSGLIPFPKWVTQACIGVTVPVPPVAKGETTVHVNLLLAELHAQAPQPQSSEAAEWIESYRVTGGVLPLREHEIEVIQS